MAGGVILIDSNIIQHFVKYFKMFFRALTQKTGGFLTTRFCNNFILRLLYYFTDTLISPSFASAQTIFPFTASPLKSIFETASSICV